MNPKFDPQIVRVYRGGGALIAAGLLGAVVGGVIVALGWWLAPDRTAYAYLSMYCGFTSLALGALLLLMIVHVMKAKWPIVMRRLLETLVASLPILALGFIPIGLSVERIYPWVEPVPHHLPHHALELIEKKRAYLETTFFWSRAAFYWASWLVPAWLLLAWSKRQDDSAEVRIRTRQRQASAVALPLVGLSLTFASFDWIMSLEPAWFSTIFGIDIFSGGFVGAIAIMTVVVTIADTKGWLSRLVSSSHYYALGRMLLAFVIFWAYIAFFQFFIIWLANRPEEVEWYMHRLEHGWWIVALVIIVGHFVVPFVLLLSYRFKRRRGPLAGLAIWIVAMHFVDVHWKVAPALPDAAIVHWADFGAFLFLGGLCSAFATWWLRGRPIAPRLDPLLGKGSRYHRV